MNAKPVSCDGEVIAWRCSKCERVYGRGKASDRERDRDDADFCCTPRLTAREVEVLGLIARDLSTREIAVELDLSIKTVETHRSNIMRKLNAHSVLELLRAGVAAGVLGEAELLGSVQ